MGTSRESVNVIWDTGSTNLLVETDLCASCSDPKYDTTSGTNYVQSATEHTETYGSGLSLTGYEVTDTICVADDLTACVADFDWIAVTAASGLSTSEDGIIGLSRTDFGTDTLYVP